MQRPPFAVEKQLLPFADWFAVSAVSQRRRGRPAPLLVYHKTTAAFDQFSIDKRELGFHFGTLAQLEGLARYRDVPEGTNIRPAYLSIQNPLRLQDEGSFHADGIVLQLARKGMLSMSEARAIRQEIDLNFRARKHYDPIVREMIRERGFDGVVYTNKHEGGGNSWIAFEPWQIRSAFEVHAELHAAKQVRQDKSHALATPLAEQTRAADALDFLQHALRSRSAAVTEP